MHGSRVLLGHLLRAQMLLDGQREVRAALDRRVVRDDHALASLDDADPGDDAGARRLAVVDVPGRERVQLEERRARIDEPVDPLAREQLARASGAARSTRSPPPAATSALRSRNSATSACICACRRAKSSRLLDAALQQRHGVSLDSARAIAVPMRGSGILSRRAAESRSSLLAGAVVAAARRSSSSC